MNRAITYAAAATVALTLSAPTNLHARETPAQPDLMVATIQAGAQHIQWLFTVASEAMSEADYAFRPTPQVRSFAELLAHVAETNHSFCAAALGLDAPVRGLESAAMPRESLRQALTESFAYCDEAFAAMSDPAGAEETRLHNGQPLPALALLNFRNYHALLHWGNAIKYMRLRGKEPPSASGPAPDVQSGSEVVRAHSVADDLLTDSLGG